MEFWVTQVIISAVQAIVIIGGVVAVLRWSNFVTRREFKKQTEAYDRRFKALAAQDLDLNATLKRINKRLDCLEAQVDRRFGELESKLDTMNGGAK